MFRVRVATSVVNDSPNGAMVYTSAPPPQYPLGLDTSLLQEGATITEALVHG